MALTPYHHPMVMQIKSEDPDLPAYYYDPLIHPIPFYKTETKTQSPFEEGNTSDKGDLSPDSFALNLIVMKVYLA